MLADKFLNEDGRLAFVLPAAFLRVRSTEGIRKFLSEKYNVEYIITGKKRLNFSESTWRREILFVAKKVKGAEKRKKAVFVAIEKLPKTMEDLERICAKIKSVKGSYEDHALISLIHEILEYRINRLFAPYRKMINSLIELIEQLIYKEKEIVVEQILSDFEVLAREGLLLEKIK